MDADPLARDIRMGREYVAADHLLTGDQIELDGQHWWIEAMRVRRLTVVLELAPGHWVDLDREYAVRIIERVGLPGLASKE